MSAPAFRSAIVTSRCPLFLTAAINEVQPSLFRAFRFAPARRSVVITSGFVLLPAASISGVSPDLFGALTFEPFSIEACTFRGVPVCTSWKKSFGAQAKMRAVSNARTTATTIRLFTLYPRIPQHTISLVLAVTGAHDSSKSEATPLPNLRIYTYQFAGSVLFGSL